MPTSQPYYCESVIAEGAELAENAVFLPQFGQSCRLQERRNRGSEMVYSTRARICDFWSSLKNFPVRSMTVASRIWPHMCTIALVYFVTLCLFPGIESEITNCSLGSWMPVLLMATFNFFDLVGNPPCKCNIYVQGRGNHKTNAMVE